MSVKKSPKIQKLVVNAIRKLQDVQGSTPREISNYISQEYDVPSTKIQRQVRMALARAVSYGILQRSKGGYYTCNREFIGCQTLQEDAQPLEKCGHRRGGMKRMKSRRRRKKDACGAASSGRRRRRGRSSGGCGGKSRRRSRRGRSGGGGCGGGGKKSRRRRGRRGGKASCGGGGGSRRRSARKGGRRRRGRRSGGGGKKCASIGKSGDKRINEDFFSNSGKRRRSSLSRNRNENRSGSVSPSMSDDEPSNDKFSADKNLESPENLLD